MLADFYAHLYTDDPKAAEETFEDDDFDPDEVASRIGQVGDWEDLSNGK